MPKEPEHAELADRGTAAEAVDRPGRQPKTVLLQREPSEAVGWVLQEAEPGQQLHPSRDVSGPGATVDPGASIEASRGGKRGH